MDETNDTAGATGSTPGEDAGRVPSDSPGKSPDPDTAQIPPVGSLMPLSMPAFNPEQQVASPGDPLPGGGHPSSELPPFPQGAGPFEADGPSPETPRRQRRRKAATTLVAAVLLAGGLGAGLGAAFGANSPRPTALSHPPVNAPLAANGSVLRVSQIAKPAIVDIRTSIASAVGQGAAEAAGTGMIVTASGEVLTNNHVVMNATNISVSINGQSKTYPAKVLGVDPTHDVALIKIEGVSNLPYVSLGDSSKVAVGDPVVAIGNALGLGGSPSVVNGIVSALNRTITASDSASGANSEVLHGLIQTSAPISPGDSGGPLLNLRGQVIGMDTAASAADGTGATLGFAIPINDAAAIVRQIEHGTAGNGVLLGESAFLGVTQQPTYGFGIPGNTGSQTPTTVQGVAIGPVVQSSPAAQAGLQSGDVITSINGQKTASWAALEQQIGSHKPGDTISLSYLDQNGAGHTASVQLVGLPK